MNNLSNPVEKWSRVLCNNTITSLFSLTTIKLMYKHICPPSVVSPCLKRLLVILEKTPRGHIQKPRTDRLQRPKSEAPSPASGGPFAECIVPLKPSFVEEIAKNRPAVSAGRGQQMSCDCPVGCPRKNLHAGIDSAARLARFQERTPLCQL